MQYMIINCIPNGKSFCSRTKLSLNSFPPFVQPHSVASAWSFLHLKISQALCGYYDTDNPKHGCRCFYLDSLNTATAKNSLHSLKSLNS